jgi:hypothetical protein
MAEREGFYAALISKAEVLAGYKFTMRLIKNIAEKVPASVPGYSSGRAAWSSSSSTGNASIAELVINTAKHTVTTRMSAGPGWRCVSTYWRRPKQSVY